jgi:hypothetical protein
MEDVSVKDEDHRIVDQLPEHSTWDDLMHEIYGNLSKKGSWMARKDAL